MRFVPFCSIAASRRRNGYWDTMLLIALVALGAVWLAGIIGVIALCVSAAEGDRYTLPRRSTWRTVCSNSLRSSQSDQFAT